MAICEVCGLPEDLCICEEIARESQKITISVNRRKFGKSMTVVEGINEKSIDINDLAKKLKGELACGGTVKDGRIELQGDHRNRVKDILIKSGYSENLMEVR
ncbi:translation initiation factor Sui1 [archaeon BMS3Bbin15]|nr:translation initiation factor Sui1 [archaeon BMS3Bbin15]